MKIAVTGGAGFIASHIVDAYVNEGHEVIVIDNLCTGFKKNLNKNAKFYFCDICDEKQINYIFNEEKPDVINHHAAQMDVRMSTKEPFFDARVNVGGSINIMECCRKNDVKKIIYSNTGGALYGEVDEKDLPVDEEYPINPLSQYGISKHTVEHYLHLYSQNYGIKYTSFRYPNVFGPRQNPHGEAGVVAIFTEKMIKGETPEIFGDGKQTRDYVHVEDVVQANITALSGGDNDYFNLGSGGGISVLNIFDILKNELEFNREPLFRPARIGEIMHIALDSTKIQERLGWRIKNSFDDAIKKTVEYYKNEKSSIS